jgi:hypothetical protein
MPSVRHFVVLTILVLLQSCSGEPQKASSPVTRSILPQPQVAAASPLEGLWTGSWGGGDRPDGIVMQPVIAELLVVGDRIKFKGFPKVSEIEGTLSIDPSIARLTVTPATTDEPHSFSCKLAGNTLTLSDDKGPAVSLEHYGVLHTAPVNLKADLVPATIDDAGNLVITEFVELCARTSTVPLSKSYSRTIKTDDATVMRVDQDGLSTITVNEARQAIPESAPVVVIFRPMANVSTPYDPSLLETSGMPSPTGAPAMQTLARTLRPGTLVFVVPNEERLVPP